GIMEHSDVSPSLKDYMYMTTNLGNVSSTLVLPNRSNGIAFENPLDSGVQLYDFGLEGTAPRAFYPPMIEDQTFAIYFGTNALLKSTDLSFHYLPVSPVLSPLSEPEIIGGVDVITAIAVAPTNPSRVYVGLYSGRTFYSTSPCSGAGCWNQ